MHFAGWQYLGLVCGLLLCGGCADASGSLPGRAAPDQRTIQVVATVGMVADVVRNVGGQRVDVRQLMGSGVDPHLYKATRDDVQAIMQADLVFYVGLMLEGKMIDTLVKLARTKPIHAFTESIPDDSLLEPDDLGGHYDPHVWMDVAAWGHCVDGVAAVLAEFDPRHAETYRANANRYRAELIRLDTYAREVAQTIPAEQRVLVTSHDAFNYFGRAYGLEVQGVQGVSTESEAGLQRINALVDLLVEKDVQAVFVESSVPRKSIEAIIRGAKARGHEVAIGGELYSDAMGPAGTYEGTYVGMIDHNITMVTRALGGQAPQRGMQGKLGLP